MKKQSIIAVTAMVLYGAFQLMSANHIQKQVSLPAAICAENKTHTMSNAPIGTATQLPVIIHIDL